MKNDTELNLKYINKKKNNVLLYLILIILSIVFLAPIFIVLYNSFKGKLYISRSPFALPNSTSFSGLANYVNGIDKTGFISAFGYSLFITVGSTAVIILFTSMTAWYITRVKSKFTSCLYYLFVLSIDIEEAAMIDGCSPVKTFFLIVLPLLKPIAITIAILNVMWIWNDYLLPYLLLGTEYKTIPIAVQYLRGGYGAVDMGAMMAILVLAIIPIVIFYLTCQKHIIEGIAAGAVKG